MNPIVLQRTNIGELVPVIKSTSILYAPFNILFSTTDQGIWFVILS